MRDGVLAALPGGGYSIEDLRWDFELQHMYRQQ